LILIEGGKVMPKLVQVAMGIVLIMPITVIAEMSVVENDLYVLKPMPWFGVLLGIVGMSAMASAMVKHLLVKDERFLDFYDLSLIVAPILPILGLFCHTNGFSQLGSLALIIGLCGRPIAYQSYWWPVQGVFVCGIAYEITLGLALYGSY
jgi:hypothetical protein